MLGFENKDKVFIERGLVYIKCILLNFRDALIISMADALTSIFSGFVVFLILGYMAEIQGKDITDPSVATDGKAHP